MTNSSRKRDRSVMMSSVRPSARRSCCGSPERLSNGSTAIEGLSGSGSAGLASAAPLPAISATVAGGGALGRQSAYQAPAAPATSSTTLPPRSPPADAGAAPT